MKSKLESARLASNDGIPVIIADGRKENVITEIISGNDEGTFLNQRKLGNRMIDKNVILNIGKNAKLASRELAKLSSRKKNSILQSMAEALRKDRELIKKKMIRI